MNHAGTKVPDSARLAGRNAAPRHVLTRQESRTSMDSELRLLFHRLNNQLGIILAHAELLEAKAMDDVNRARAAQIVASVLDAMGTAREIRGRSESAEADN